MVNAGFTQPVLPGTSAVDDVQTGVVSDRSYVVRGDSQGQYHQGDEPWLRLPLESCRQFHDSKESFTLLDA